MLIAEDNLFFTVHINWI